MHVQGQAFGVCLANKVSLSLFDLHACTHKAHARMLVQGQARMHVQGQAFGVCLAYEVS